MMNFRAVNTLLRTAVKRVGMGRYVHSLSNYGPLHHKMNNSGSKIAFKNCRVYDGIHPEFKEEMTLLVAGDQILDIGRREQVPIPDDFFIVDAAGRSILPGFIDSHVHMCSPFTYDLNIPAIRQMRKQITLNNMRTVYSGVTTICDMGGPQGIIKEFKNLADKNDTPGPRYLNSFTLISPRKGRKLGYPNQVKLIDPFQAWLLEGQVATRPKTLKSLQKACYKVRDDGGTHIKITYQPYPFSAKKPAVTDNFPIFNDEWMETIFRIAKETGLAVSIHSPFRASTEKCVDLAIEAGAKIRIQHMTFDADLKAETIRKMSDYGFYIIPTVMIYGDSLKMTSFISWLNDNPETHMTPEANRQIKSRIQKAIELESFSGREVLELDNVYFRENFDFVRRNTRKAHEAGVIGFGTDTGGTYTGFFGRILSEMMHYNEFGIPLFDLLKYMTSVNAEINGLNDRGVVLPGKLADLIMLSGNPDNDVSALGDVQMVMKGGVFLKYGGIELTAA